MSTLTKEGVNEVRIEVCLFSLLFEAIMSIKPDNVGQ